ncbi:unnamed protein product [Prunus armeniaca]
MSANRMFFILAMSQPSKAACFHTTTQDMSQLWHRRYGHLSYKGLRTLQFKKMVHGLPQLAVSTTVCKDCMIGKQQRDPFPKKSIWRASQKLQLIHADLCGPITPISNSNKRVLLRKKQALTLSVYVPIVEENLLHKNSINSVRRMASRGS